MKLPEHELSWTASCLIPCRLIACTGGAAPEILTSRCRYDAKLADVWSCGVMLYIMLFCAYPFERPEDTQLGPKRQAQANARRILAADYQLPASKPVSRECCDLLARILVPSPHDRISVPEIQQHPWFQEVRVPMRISLRHTSIAGTAIHELVLQRFKPKPDEIPCILETLWHGGKSYGGTYQASH